MTYGHDGVDRLLCTHYIIQDAVKRLQSRIKKQKAEISSRSTDIARLLQRKEAALKHNSELELQIKEKDYTIKELQQEATDCEKRVSGCRLGCIVVASVAYKIDIHTQ